MITFKQFITESAKLIQFPRKKKIEPSKPVSDQKHVVKDWAHQHIIHDDSSSLTTTGAYEHYCERAEKHGKSVHSYPEFKKHMREIGYDPYKIAGWTRYMGVKFD